MGFFSKFLGKKDNTEHAKNSDWKTETRTLLDVVPKIHNSEYGALVDAINDLAKFAEDTSKHSPLLLMAYAYARRSASAGIFLQGIIEFSDYEYVEKIFKSFQIQTIHTAEFQEKSAHLAMLFLSSYHPSLTREVLSIMTSMVGTGKVHERYTGNSFMQLDVIITQILNIQNGVNIIAEEVKLIDNTHEEGEKLFNKAMKMYEDGNTQKAIQYFNKSIEACNTVASAFFGRGAMYQNIELYLLAYEDYMKAIKVEQEYPSATQNDTLSIINGIHDNMQTMKTFLDFNDKNGNALRTAYNTDGHSHFCKRTSEILYENFINNIDELKFFIAYQLVKLSILDNNKYEYILSQKIKNLYTIMTDDDFKKLSCNIDCYFDVFNIEEKTEHAIHYITSNLTCFSSDAETMNHIRSGIIENLYIILIKNNPEEKFTSIFSPKVEIQDHEGLICYANKLSDFEFDDFCIELSNVRAAKHNLLFTQSTLPGHGEKQLKITDLNDKSFLILAKLFGYEELNSYVQNDFLGDLRAFHKQFDNIDDIIAQQHDLSPREHGEKLILELSKKIQNNL